MDRVSAFADEETIELLKKSFVPVGVSLTELGKSRDTAGDFFRKITEQRIDPKHSKQGFYICSPDGRLIEGWMYPRPDDGKVKQALRDALTTYVPPKQIEKLDETRVDRQCNPKPPDGTVVVEVSCKLTDAKWGPSPAKRVEMIRGSVGHDRLWILKAEREAIAKGTMPDSLLERMIRFHLLDNTRGVPERWLREDVRKVRATLTPHKGGMRLEGMVQLADKDDRKFDAALYGIIEMKGAEIVRFDLVARGTHSAKKASVGEVPIGDATLAIAFALAEKGESSRVVPLYTWDPADYLRTDNLRVTELRRAK